MLLVPYRLLYVVRRRRRPTHTARRRVGGGTEDGEVEYLSGVQDRGDVHRTVHLDGDVVYLPNAVDRRKDAWQLRGVVCAKDQAVRTVQLLAEPVGL